MKRLRIVIVTLLAALITTAALCACSFGSSKKNPDGYGTIIFSIHYIGLTGGTPEGFERLDAKLVEEGWGPQTPSKSGFEFLGWYNMTKYHEEYRWASFDPEKFKNHGYPDDMYYDQTKAQNGEYGSAQFVAIMRPYVYTISFADDNGVDVSNVPGTYTVLENIRLPDLTAPEGYNAYWGSGDLVFSTGFIQRSTVGDLSLSPKYIPIQYEMTFKLAGGAMTEDKAFIAYDSEFTLPVPTREHYNFVGWYADDLKMTDATGRGLFKYTRTDGGELVAHWERIMCTVTFDTMGGSAMAPIQIGHGDTFNYDEMPQKAEEMFLCWMDKENVEYGSEFVVTSDMTIYAKWVASKPISNKADFLAMLAAPSGYGYYLAGNINLENAVITPCENFAGLLDGRGYTVRNFSLNSNTFATEYGMIKANRGTIRNIKFNDYTCNLKFGENDSTLENGAYGVFIGTNYGKLSDIDFGTGTVTVSFGRSVDNESTRDRIFGTIVGRNNGRMVRCTADASITANFYSECTNTYWAHTSRTYFYLGGVTGLNYGKMKNCGYTRYIEANCRSTSYRTASGSYTRGYCFAIVGGLIGGQFDNGTCEDSYAECTVKCVDAAGTYNSNCTNTGGLIGWMKGSVKLSTSYFSGSVETNINTDSYVGGVIGSNDGNGEILSCYAVGSVTAVQRAAIGGFVGINDSIVQNSYAVVTVESKDSGSNTGGFVGSNLKGGTVSKSYASSDVTAKGGNCGFFVGTSEGTLFLDYAKKGNLCSLDGNYRTDIEMSNVLSFLPVTKLWSKEFLVDEIYWDDNGWAILADQDPMLTWELDESLSGHTFTKNTVPATCTDFGFTEYYCSHCHKLFVYMGDITDPDPTGHNMVVADHGVVPASCTTDGYTEYVCTKCGDRTRVPTPATGHDPAHLVELNNISNPGSYLAPTCTAPGYRTYRCTDCQSTVRETLPAVIGRRVTSASETNAALAASSWLVAPSCTVALYHCTACSSPHYYNVDLDEPQHTWEDVGYKAPHCAAIAWDGQGKPTAWETPEDGHTFGEVCTVCGEYTYEIIPAHNVTDKTVTVAPTCTEHGTATGVCTLCGMTTEVDVPATGHTDDNRDALCDVCGSLLVLDGIDPNSFLHISTAEQLRQIKMNNSFAYYWLDNDITVNAEWTPLGTAEQPFKGILYGAGHTVSGLTFDVQVDGRYGLFGYNAGIIAGLTVNNVNITVTNSDARVGVFAASNSGTLYKCTAKNVTVRLNTSATVTQPEQTVTASFGVMLSAFVAENNGSIQSCTTAGGITVSSICSADIRFSGTFNTLASVARGTSAEAELELTFGGFAAVNGVSGMIRDCTGNAVTDLSALTQTDMPAMRGKATAYTHLYAAAIVGKNIGEISDSSAKAMTTGTTYRLPTEDSGKMVFFSYEYKLFDHAAENNGNRLVCVSGGKETNVTPITA